MKKIGEIKGVPVVEGNINEVTKNQIHYKEDSGSIQLSKRGNDNKLNSVTGSSSGGSSSGKYYLIDESLIYQYFDEEVANGLYLIEFFIMLASLIKTTTKNSNKKLIINSFAISTYLPDNIKISNVVAIKVDSIVDNGIIFDFKGYLELYGLDTTNFDKAFPRITEEEFYDLNKWSLEDYK